MQKLSIYLPSMQKKDFYDLERKNRLCSFLFRKRLFENRF